MFFFPIPANTFYDKEDGNSTQLSLQILPADGSLSGSKSWLQFNTSQQAMHGYPLEMDFQYSPQEFVLCATDSGGLTALPILHHRAPEAPGATVPPFPCADQEQLLLFPEGEEKGGFVPREALPLRELQQPQRHCTDSSPAWLHTHLLVQHLCVCTCQQIFQLVQEWWNPAGIGETASASWVCEPTVRPSNAARVQNWCDFQHFLQWSLPSQHRAVPWALQQHWADTPSQEWFHDEEQPSCLTEQCLCHCWPGAGNSGLLALQMSQEDSWSTACDGSDKLPAKAGCHGTGCPETSQSPCTRVQGFTFTSLTDPVFRTTSLPQALSQANPSHHTTFLATKIPTPSPISRGSDHSPWPGQHPEA